MKRVLILAYDFPPYVSAGSLRPYSWYQYLHGFGIYPVVVTRQWGNKHGNFMDYVSPGETNTTIIEESETGTIIRTPYNPNIANRMLIKYGDKKYRSIRKIISLYFEIAQFVFTIGPKVNLYFGAKEYLKKNKVDAIIATGDPFVLFKYASKLGRKYSIPWIADYRDIWSNDNYLKKYFFLRKWYCYFEKRTIRSSDRMIFVSEFVKQKTLPSLQNKKSFIIPNGYDSAVTENPNNCNPENRILNIGFAGTIYKWIPLEHFFAVINRVISDDPPLEFKINFYGTNINNEIDIMITKNFPLLKNYVCVFPKTPYENVIRNLAKNNILLLFNYYSFMGTKIYDYLGIRRKILFCFSDDTIANEFKNRYYSIDDLETTSSHLQEDLINKTNSGIIVKDSNHLYFVLKDLIKEFDEKGFIECNSVGVEQYSRKKQVEILAEVLNSVD